MNQPDNGAANVAGLLQRPARGTGGLPNGGARFTNSATESETSGTRRMLRNP